MAQNRFYKIKEFFGFIEEDQAVSDAMQQESEKQPVVRSFKGSVLHNQHARQFTLSEIKVEEPRIYEDSLLIATHLRDNKPVVVNLKYLDNATGKRLIDFICGTAYAINGHMMKIGENIFLFTPENVLIAEQSDKHTPPVQEVENERDLFFRKAVSF